MKLPYKTPCRYLSNAYTANWIVSLLPAHRCYLDTFGGLAAVLFAKPLSQIEVYNDLDSEVFNFFFVLRNMCKEFVEYLMTCPASRELMVEFNEKDPKKLRHIERAARFFFLQMFSFSGIGKGKPTFPVRSGFRKDGSMRNVGYTQSYVKKIQALPLFQERLMKVTIENLHFRDLIKRYDWEGACFYCDPTYIDLEYYGTNMSLVEHKELSKILHAVEGKVCINYYPHPLLEELYPKDVWNWEEKEVVKQAGKGVSPTRTVKEVLLMNYDPEKNKFLGSQQAITAFMEE